MVILSDKQFKQIEKQLDEIRDIKHTVDQIFFSLNSFKIQYNCDWIRENLEKDKERLRVLDELIRKFKKD